MTLFIRWSLTYFLVASSVVVVFRGDMFGVGVRTIVNSASFVQSLQRVLPFLLPLLGITIYTSLTGREFLRRMRDSVTVLIATCAFLAAFSAIKTTMPLILDALNTRHFFADPVFAALDQTLSLGTDPWVFAHAAADALGISDFASYASFVYGVLWVIPGLYLPVIMAFLGEDKATFKHFALLYFFSWIVLGNIVALAGSSAGPIYYDRVFEGARFAELTAALSASGLPDTALGTIQSKLWLLYEENLQATGSGISAFPSVHVAMATITALYLQQKSRILGAIGWIFMAVILFLSVWSGYHYAIDGYASIAAVIGLHVYLSRRASTTRFS